MKGLVRKASLCVGASLSVFSFAEYAAAQEASDEIVVTAQRREQALQDVPIAVSAFNAETLDAQQIETFSDLQFATPNVYYTKTFFSGSNFQIRGIGVSSTAASSDTGVSIHVNDVFLQQPRLFETEYYDLERIEVLRGPQGTLYGRNATGGAVNMITRRAQIEDFEASASYEYGNYNHQRVTAMLNLPIADTLSLRLAGLALVRDGYTETVDPAASFDDLDGRDQWSGRASIRFEPTPQFSIDLIGSYFEEDDNRLRTPKVLCDADPTGVLGCTPTGLGTGVPNFSATFGGIVLSNLALGPLALFPFNTIQGNPNPADLRSVFVDEEPRYTADETFIMADIRYDLTDTLTFNLLGAYQETSVSSTQSGSPIGQASISLPALLPFALPITYNAAFADGLIPVSALHPSHAGSIGGFVQRRTNGIFSADQSDSTAEQYSVEARLSSDFSGPLNFLLAANYLEYESANDYYVFSNSLDYFALVGAGVDGLGIVVPYFYSDNQYELQSSAAFGEIYYDLTDRIRLTAGLRYTRDEKTVRDRSLPLITGTVVPIGPGAAAATQTYLENGFDADPSTAGIQAFRNATQTFEELTGRVVVDWRLSDDALLYASYGRGYKGGGFNPPVTPAIASFGVTGTFDPEFINAFEIGSKNTLLGGRLQANMTGFYYDYEGYQIGRGVARTVINENVDARIWGLEGEFNWAPTDPLQLSLTLSYLNTEIQDARSVYSRDLSAGEPGHVIIKDLLGENCLVENITPAQWTAATSFIVPGGIPLVAVPGLQSPGAVIAPLTCAQLGLVGLTPTGGIDVELDGNALPLSPEFSIAVGAQYTFALPGEFSLVARTDYRWQDETWASLFNDPRVDRIESWQVWNAQVTLLAPDERWFVRGFVQNILDDDNITAQFTGAASTGLGTSVALLEPRLYGLELGFRW